jgi:hypothetical protein
MPVIDAVRVSAVFISDVLAPDTEITGFALDGVKVRDATEVEVST